MLCFSSLFVRIEGTFFLLVNVRNLSDKHIPIEFTLLYLSESSIASLKQVAMLKSSQLPTLNQLIPYLDLSSNQEYVVQRIKGEVNF